MAENRDSLPDQSVFDRDPCDGCDGTCGDVCPVLEAQRHALERRSATAPDPPAVERNGAACLCREQYCGRHRSWHSGALAENERLREAVAWHANTIDKKVLGMEQIPPDHRDAIDNDLYNTVRSVDPAWWDTRVPGLNAVVGSPLPADEEKAT